MIDMEMRLRSRGLPMAVPITTEPCESCGWPVALLNLVALATELGGHSGIVRTANAAYGGEAPKLWHEVHEDDYTITFRQHTMDRCRRIRAGDPEPLDDDDYDGC